MPDTQPTIPELRFSAETLTAQLHAVFAAWSMPEDQAATAIQVMVETDLAGIDSHGIGMLPLYQRLYGEGRLNPRAVPRLVRDRASTALVDGDHGLGHVAGVFAMNLAMEKARASGIGVVGVTNSNHYGAAGWYARQASAQGLIGISLTNSGPLAVPTFGRDPMLGTNPIAFAAPAERNPDFLLDMATTTVAYGKVSIARRKGKVLPVGWALNPEGQPETDSAAASDSRRLSPLGGTRELGGHKGYGLAAMVEILCATLTGADLAEGAIGHFFLALDPGDFAGDFPPRVDGLIDGLRATTPVTPGQPVLVAGDPEYAEAARRAVEGIAVTAILQDEIRAVAEAAGAAFLLTPDRAL